MLLAFTKVKLPNRRSMRAADGSDFAGFQPRDWRCRRSFSGRAQRGQPFQVPTHAFELQFQTVALTSHIAHPPIARAPLPPAKYFFNLTPDRTEQPVRPHGGRAEFLAVTEFAQDAIGHAVPSAPFTPGLAPMALSAMTISLSPCTTFSNSRLSCMLAAVSVTCRISVWVSPAATCAL
jgi:hypothetical protein